MMASESSKTGVTFDHCLESHYSLWNKDFTERPERTKAAISRCQELDLLSRCKHIPVREATLKEVLTCHSQELFDTLTKTKAMTEEQLKEISQKYDYIYFHQSSMANARLALGATIDLVEEIVTDKIHNGMAIIRPPGHHAMQNEFSGYCYFNNVAVAARMMIEKHGLKRIIIFDWDVHHGQGTQFLFYHDPRVLYVSVHRYEYGEEWPFLRESDYDFTGRDTGKGYNINIPLNETDCGNDDFLSIFFNILLPVFTEFDPELVIVSAGYDSAIGCPEGEMSVTPACFAHFVNLLTPLASGKLALVLEGGYNLKSLSESVALSLRALLGDPTPCIQPVSKPKISVVQSVLNAVKVLHPYWKSLAFQDLLPLKSLLSEDHPFPGILREPPADGVEFYTAENRPDVFPLIQECFGESVMSNMEHLNKSIELLIRNTPLHSFQHRLGIYTDHSPSTNIIHSSLCQELKSLDLFSQCLPEPRSSPSVIPVAVDIILSGKAQACVAMSSSHPCRSLVDVEESCDECSGIESAIHHAFDIHHVDRILVVSMTSAGNQCLACLKEVKGVLQVNVTWPGLKEASSSVAGSQKASNNNNPDEPAGVSLQTSAAVDINFDKKPLVCGDILAAFQHVILPVAYESNVGLPGSLLGHIVQYLHGLASGRLLILADGFGSSGNPSVVEDDTDQLLACSKVLLGERCAALGSHVPSKSGIVAVRKTLDKVKDNCPVLSYRQQIPKLETPSVGHQ